MFFAEGIYDQKPCAVSHRLLGPSSGVTFLHLLTLPQVVEEKPGSVCYPGVELARALLSVEALDAPLLDVVHGHARTVQHRLF